MQAATVGYLLILMAVFWCTDVVPLAVTGLMPVFFLPLTGVRELSIVCNQYLSVRQPSDVTSLQLFTLF